MNAVTDGQIFGMIGISAFLLSGLGWGIHDAYRRRREDER